MKEGKSRKTIFYCSLINIDIHKKHMKCGRPNIKDIIQASIIETLSSSSTPLTASALAKIISDKLKRRVSWNTIQKYLNELVEIKKVQPLPLPHSKKEGKVGLTVYILKK